MSRSRKKGDSVLWWNAFLAVLPSEAHKANGPAMANGDVAEVNGAVSSAAALADAAVAKFREGWG